MNIDKQQVARHFSKAVISYNDFAQLQRDIGDNLLMHLPKTPTSRALDLGCGTGHFAHKLQATASQVVGIDLSFAMAQYAQQQNHNFYAMVCDAECISLSDQSVDIVFSNLALQWCNNLSRALREIKRILRPGGICVFSSLLDGTLWELKQAWCEIDDTPHVNQFMAENCLYEQIRLAGFADPQVQTETRTLWYPDVFALLAELKGIGANYVVDAKQGLNTAAKLRQLAKVYQQQFAQKNQVSATYQVCYGVLIND